MEANKAKLTPFELLEKVYNNFKQEAELFFVTKFIEGPAIKEEFKNCLDILFNITKTVDSNKGIIAYNPKYGQSKTFFFDVVKHRMLRTKSVNLFKKTTARELCDVYTSTKKGFDPIKELDKFIKVKNLFIDDIGDELRDGKERMVWGNRLNVVRYVLLKRYELWTNKGYKTYGTTNLTLENIAKNYDGRIADRLHDMVHWREFKFLSDGSFRQRTDTRILTQEEVRKNWQKLKPKEVVEKVDLDAYFNSMLEYGENRLFAMNTAFWTFCKTYLIAKKIIKENDFILIDDKKMSACRLKLIEEKTDILKTDLKSAPPVVYKSKKERMIQSITSEEVRQYAEGTIVRGVFMQLKKDNFIFK